MLRPIYKLMKKTEKFVWTQEHQQCFTEIKKRLSEYPVLHLPTTTGRFVLYSDTSRRHASSSMWQMQNGQPKLIGYSSKTLPKACLNYSVTELEMFGLSINLHQWNHLIAKIDFDCATDHLAAVQIMHGKDEPKGRIGRILEKILDYTFRLYYVKGKDLILANYFSHVPADCHQANEVIPISFVNLCRPDDLTVWHDDEAMSTGCWGDSSKGPLCGQRSRPTCETQTSETSFTPFTFHHF